MPSAAAPKTVKAIRYHGNKDIRYEDVPVVTELMEGQVRLKPAWCGICGTDVHEYSHGPFVSYSKESPHPLTGHHRPIIFGHEFSGVVTEVHPSVTSHKIGDAVAVEGLLTDDSCEQCKNKRRNACDQTAFLGLSTSPGGLCEDIVIPAFICHILPPHVGLDAGALVEPLSVAWHGVTQSGIQPGDSAIIFGAGPIGLALILCLRARGITTILASEPSLARHAQATKIGATHCFNPLTDDVVKGAKDLCDGYVIIVLFFSFLSPIAKLTYVQPRASFCFRCLRSPSDPHDWTEGNSKVRCFLQHCGMGDQSKFVL